MAKTASLAFRISEDMKADLERVAADDDRSVSSLVERILREWLEQRGLLGQQVVKTVKPARKPAKLKMLEPRIPILDTRTAKPAKGR